LFDTPPDDDHDDNDDEQQHMVAPQRPSVHDKNNINNKSPAFHHQLDHHGLFDQEDDDDDDDDDDRSRECTLKIRQRIRPDKVVEFHRWRRRLLHAMDLLDEDLSKNRHGVIAVQWDVHSPDDENQETRITFQSIDDLNAYMLSPIRRRFLRRLQPLLVSPSHVQVRRGSGGGRGGTNQNHNNAMTDLCHTQGRNKERPVRPPKKWKVWFITTLALYSVVLLVDECLPHYLDAWWGLDVDVNETSSAYYERLAAQVLRNICTTVLNAYVATPFLTMIFRHWLLRRRRRRVVDSNKDEEEKDDDHHQPWIFWSDGAESMLVKTMIFVTFYGGMALAWYLQRVER
jgi:antibiotic biosynthesis monooxygenase (ABM) superfamily enzyme